MGGKILPLIWSPEPSLHDLAAVPFGRRSGSSWRSFSGLFRPLATAPAGFSSSPSRRNLAAWLRARSAPGLRSAELVPGVTADPLRWPGGGPLGRCAGGSWRSFSGLFRPLATAPAGFSSRLFRSTWRPGCLTSGGPFGLCAGGLWRAFSGLVWPVATARRASLRGRPGQPGGLAAGVVRSGPAVC